MKRENIYLIVLPLILTVVLTIPFYLTNLDISYMSLFFKNGEWYMGENKIVKILYDIGPLPAMLSAVVSLAILIGSIFKTNMKKYRRYAVFIILFLIIAPGILVNAVFKEYWGRPRPRETINFGGTEKYVPPLTIGKLEFPGNNNLMLESQQGRFKWDILRSIYKVKGKYNSFPAGHASVGFFMMFPFFIFYKKNKMKAGLFLGIGIMYGLVMGIGRNIQGGHFLSDVIWAGIFVYFTGIALYYIMGFNKDNEVINENKKGREAV